VIGQNDEQIGIIETVEALAMAREAGLDLVEVAPQSSPPVCRIMDYGKWKYSQSKDERRSRAQRHEVELKEIRIKTPKIGEHDLQIKVDHAHEFLQRGDRVQFGLRFRGRELAHIDEGLKVFEKIRDALADISKVEQHPRREGRRITMMLSSTVKKISKKKPPKKDKKDKKDTPAAETAPPATDAEAPPAEPETGPAETPSDA